MIVPRYGYKLFIKERTNSGTYQINNEKFANFILITFISYVIVWIDYGNFFTTSGESFSFNIYLKTFLNNHMIP